MYALNFIDGGIYALTPPAGRGEKTQPPFPRKLSQTGLFSDTAKLTPEKGLIPYSVNSELWSDGATKERFIAIPGDAKIEFETVTYPQPAPGSVPGWRFPNGTVFVKTFFLETEPGKKKRLETRLLHVNVLGGTEEYGDQVWNGYTYIWNDDQTDAELADKNGVDREYTLKTAAGEKKQKWHFPSRAECNLCHTVTAKYALGVNTAQMNKDHDYGGVVANQLATLDHIDIFTKKLPKKPEELAKLADPRDEKAACRGPRQRALPPGELQPHATASGAGATPSSNFLNTARGEGFGRDRHQAGAGHLRPERPEASWCRATRSGRWSTTA